MPDVFEAERQLLLLLIDQIDANESLSEPAIEPQEAADFLAAVLAVLVRTRLGDAATLETIAAYARQVIAGPETVERPMLIESVLRTGAGYPDMLSGVGQEEVVHALGICMRFLFRDMSAGRSDFETTLIASAARARESGVFGAGIRSPEGLSHG
ncbi:hypothetical protein ACIB24_14755 [Spongisporangium articulatum]|uniref:Uncharacterized protein n=1 Tax=Spongisporangium articulatum TaxID=3362603 RepID=A0ABW8APQ9_9ACTN